MKTLIALALAAASLATQAQTITSADGTVYTPVLASLRTEGEGYSMLWLFRVGSKHERMRIAITGCEAGGGSLALLTPRGEQIVPATEWVEGGPGMIDGIAEFTCSRSGPWLAFRKGAR